jgi:hypothetical protein
MKRLIVVMAASVAMACSAPSPTAPSATGASGSLDAVVPDMADHGGRALEAPLAGAGVIPGPGDPDGSGQFNMSANGGQAEICYALRALGIGTITEVHLHYGEAGVNGENVFTLALPTGNYSRGCVDNLDRRLIHSILSKPADYYIAVHTAEYPDGALRGQLAFNRKPY